MTDTLFQTMLGLTLSMGRPRTPPILPSPDVVLHGALKTSASIMYCAPTFLEVRRISTFQGVPKLTLTTGVGDGRIEHGRNEIIPLYCEMRSDLLDVHVLTVIIAVWRWSRTRRRRNSSCR